MTHGRLCQTIGPPCANTCPTVLPPGFRQVSVSALIMPVPVEPGSNARSCSHHPVPPLPSLSPTPARAPSCFDSFAADGTVISVWGKGGVKSLCHGKCGCMRVGVWGHLGTSSWLVDVLVSVLLISSVWKGDITSQYFSTDCSLTESLLLST